MVKRASLKNRRKWTSSQRQQQREKIHDQKIWLKATGPKTIEGKKRSSKNALKHGMRSATTQKFKKFLRMQRQLLKQAKAHERITRMKRRMVLAMLENGITSENFSRTYKRNESYPCFTRKSGDRGPFIRKTFPPDPPSHRENTIK